MITNAQKPQEQIPPLRKAALLLILLGEQTCADILKEMSQEEVEDISKEMLRCRRIAPEQAEGVIEEYYQMSLARHYAAQGGVDFAKKVLQKAFGPEAAKRTLDLVGKQHGSQPANFDVLQKADPQQLAKFIHNEHPQTIALILSHLGSSQAAALLGSLPMAMRADIVFRMANLDQISPEAIHRITAVIGQKLKSLGDYSRESHGGVRAVAEICNRLDSGTSKEIIEEIEKRDVPMAETIKHLMFVFEDVLMIDEMGMREIISRVDRKVLITALKGTSDQLRNHFIQFMSTRAAEMLREDIEAMGPVKIKSVDAAQQQIIGLVRQLEQQGVISLRGTVGEQYVI